jgi:hypothetical protein
MFFQDGWVRTRFIMLLPDVSALCLRVPAAGTR